MLILYRRSDINFYLMRNMLKEFLTVSTHTKKVKITEVLKDNFEEEL